LAIIPADATLQKRHHGILNAAFERRIRKWKCSAKHLPEHFLAFFEYWENPLELSELTETIDIPSMQEDDSRTLAFVMVGDAGSVERRERFHHVSKAFEIIGHQKRCKFLQSSSSTKIRGHFA